MTAPIVPIGVPAPRSLIGQATVGCVTVVFVGGCWSVIAFLAFTLFVGPVLYLPPAVRAATGHGRPGTLVVTQHSGGRGSSTTGNFVSDDGTIDRRGVSYDGYPGDVQPGTTLRAIDVGDEAVYAYPHSAVWVIWVLALCVDVLIGYAVVAHLRRWRAKVRARQENSGT